MAAEPKPPEGSLWGTIHRSGSEEFQRELLRLLLAVAAVAAFALAAFRLLQGNLSLASFDLVMGLAVLGLRVAASRAGSLQVVTLCTAGFVTAGAVAVAHMGLQYSLLWTYAFLPALFFILRPLQGSGFWLAGVLGASWAVDSAGTGIMFVASHALIATYCALFAGLVKQQRLHLAEQAEKAEREGRLQSVLYAIADLSTREMPTRELLRCLHAQIAGMVYAENLYITLFDPTDQRVDFVYFADAMEQPDALGIGMRCTLDELKDGLTWHVLTAGHPLRGDMDTIRSRLPKGSTLKILGTAPVQWLGVPLIASGQVRGMLAVQSYRRGVGFSESDEALLGFVGNHVLQAIERSRLLALVGRVYEAMPGVLLVLSPDLRVIKANAEAARLLGVPADVLIGRRVDTVLPEARQLLLAMLKAEVSGLRREEVSFRSDAGEDLPMLLTITSEIDADGCLEYLLVIGEDLRERNRLEGELRHAQKLEALGEMAAGIAHEINTPMQFVGDQLGFIRQAALDLLAVADGGAPPEANLDFIRRRLPRAVERASEGVARVSRIVAAMRQFAHPGTSLEPTDLNALVDSTLIVAANSFKYVADLDLELGALPQVPVIRGDLGQVLLNLVNNAAHSMEARHAQDGGRGRLRISTGLSSEPGFAEIRVEDTGTGVPAHLKQRIFEPFFTTKPVGKGTGQGLSLSRLIVVERHGGQLILEDVQPHGARFIIRLPLLAPSAPAPAAPG
jgi:two-component system, NtrC family, sensor kinase